MSRSIHETRHHWNRISQSRYADPELKKKLLQEASERLDEKRTVKAHVKRDRIVSDALPRPESSAPPEIEYRDESEFVHYLLTPDDIRELIKVLPRGILDDISRVVFTLGKEYMAEREPEFEDNLRDPYTGRRGEKAGDQVFIPPILGTYTIEAQRISLYAYVYTLSDIKNPHILFLCKLRQFSTLLHEIAHHDDRMRRTGRGRWLGCHSSKAENYACESERSWSGKFLPSFLLNRYPAESTGLLAWIQERTGIEMDLTDILHQAFLGSGMDALLAFMKAELEGKPLPEARFEFAENLHFNEQYELCVRCCDAYLLDDSDNVPLLAMKADILVHLSRFEDAETVVLRCLELDPVNLSALDSRCDILFLKKDWPGVLETSSRFLDLSGVEDRLFRYRMQQNKIISLLHLGKTETAREVCAEITNRGSLTRRRQAFLAFIDLLEGKYGKAIEASETVLKDPKSLAYERAISHFVYTEALKRSGISGHFYRMSRRYSRIPVNLTLPEILDLHFPFRKE